jgi:hypothetical protein
MNRIAWSVAGVVAAAVIALVGLGTSSDEPSLGGGGGGFRPCPQPPCLAPCNPSEPPEVLCKAPDGSTFVTTFECCCCGSGENSYRPRRGPR